MHADSEQLDLLITAIQQGTEAIQHLTEAVEIVGQKIGLGEHANTLYTRPPVRDGLVDERTMASMLGISNRTLGKYRRQGRLPGCWIRNAGRITWKVTETQEAWERGIA